MLFVGNTTIASGHAKMNKYNTKLAFGLVASEQAVTNTNAGYHQYNVHFSSHFLFVTKTKGLCSHFYAWARVMKITETRKPNHIVIRHPCHLCSWRIIYWNKFRQSQSIGLVGQIPFLFYKFRELSSNRFRE